SPLRAPFSYTTLFRSPAADAEMLALALQASNVFGITDVEIRTGDVALFNALIDALDLYPVWRRRLIKDFNRNVSLTDDIERLTRSEEHTSELQSPDHL